MTAPLTRGDHVEVREGRTWCRAEYLRTAPNGRLVVRKLRKARGAWKPATRFVDPIHSADVRLLPAGAA